VGEKAKRFLVVVVKVIVPAECVADAIFLVSIILRTLVAGYVVIGTAAFAAGATKILRVDASTADARTYVPTRLKGNKIRTQNCKLGVQSNQLEARLPNAYPPWISVLIFRG